jgi:DNA polymerase-4
LASGVDARPVTPTSEEKSIGAETTFPEDLPRGGELDAALLALADKAAHRMRGAGAVCQTVAIKVRTADFATISRSRTLPAPTDLTKQIAATARELLASTDLHGLRVRLLGVRLENLTVIGRLIIQATLDEPEGAIDDLRHAQAAGDAVRKRFGTESLRPATLLPGPHDFRT